MPTLPSRSVASTQMLDRQAIGAKHPLPHGVQAGTEEQEVILQRKARRRTIYIPSDNTTILTIHPGSRSNGTACDGLDVGRHIIKKRSTLHDRMPQSSRRARKSLATAPRRTPLQPLVSSLQEREGYQDFLGAGPGKENVTPHTMRLMTREGSASFSLEKYSFLS